MRSPCLPDCAGSACRSGQADERIIAHCGDCLKGQVSGSLDCPLIILLEQQRTDEAHDGVRAAIDSLDRLLHALTIGKMPTTSVRRLISPFSRSIGFVL